MTLFFSFDGIDGTGKTTQVDLFCQWLTEQGRQVARFRDPGSTPLGELLRDVLLRRSDVPLAPRSETLLYMAARAELVQRCIRPALSEGRVVVTDRYLLANVAYQGYGHGLEPGMIWEVGTFATGGLMPDCTFLLDLDVEEAARRRGAPGDRLEDRGDEYLARVRDGFLAEAARRTGIEVIPAAGTIEEVQERIRRTAAKWLGPAPVAE